MKTMPNKTDRNDARALAQIMRTGWFRQVHVKSRHAGCGVRFWLRAGPFSTRCGRSKTWCGRSCGRPALSSARRAARISSERVRELAGGDATVTALVEPLLAILATMLREFTRLTKRVLDITRRDEICRRLMSVPGVGPISALAFRATIDRPDRFKRSRDVGAHLGLTPARYQSGETDIQGQGQPVRR